MSGVIRKEVSFIAQKDLTLSVKFKFPKLLWVLVGEIWDTMDKRHDITPNLHFRNQIVFNESKWIALSVFWISGPQLQIFFSDREE